MTASVINSIDCALAEMLELIDSGSDFCDASYAASQAWGVGHTELEARYDALYL